METTTTDEKRRLKMSGSLGDKKRGEQGCGLYKKKKGTKTDLPVPKGRKKMGPHDVIFGFHFGLNWK